MQYLVIDLSLISAGIILEMPWRLFIIEITLDITNEITWCVFIRFPYIHSQRKLALHTLDTSRDSE